MVSGSVREIDPEKLSPILSVKALLNSAAYSAIPRFGANTCEPALLKLAHAFEQTTNARWQLAIATTIDPARLQTKAASVNGTHYIP